MEIIKLGVPPPSSFGWGGRWLFVVCFCCAVWSTGVSAAEDLEPVDGRFVMTYESLTLPANEKMGLLGGAFLYDATDWLAIGGGAYGAMEGQRGGFITLGIASELRRRLSDRFELKFGAFVGAGGGRGGYTLQGGGLMIRSYGGGAIKLGDLGSLGAGLSRVSFPNGNIHSTQAYLSYEYPFSALIPQGWLKLPRGEFNFGFGPRRIEHELAVGYRYYAVASGVMADDGVSQQHSIGLVGIEWDRYLDKNLFLKVESEGALKGESNGYMQILLGLGYRTHLFRSSWIKLSGALGPAGGGRVDTGGGVLLDGQVRLEQKLGDHLFAELGLGYVNAPGGSFKADGFSATLGYHIFSPDVRKRLKLADLYGYHVEHLRIRFVDQRYIKAAENWRTHHPELNIDLLGFQADYFLNDWLYLSGQGIAAYKGQAGGYMTGLIGGGVRLPLSQTAMFFEADVLAGAAGGGGVDVGGGLVSQADAGVGWQLSKVYDLQVKYGMMRAPKGHFRARVWSVSLGYAFSLLGR